MPRPRHWLLLALCAAPAVLHAQRAGYHPAPEPRLRLSSESGLRIDVLVDAAALGGAEVEVAEITFPAGGRSGGAHRHGGTELLYILSGRLDHVVNDVVHRLDPGMTGIVRAGDRVEHRVSSAEAVRALVIWAPGGELERIRRGFRETEAPTHGVRLAHDLEGLRTLREQWSQAYQRGDADVLEPLYTRSIVRMPYDAPAEIGRDTVLASYRRAFAGRQMDPTITLTPGEVQVMQDIAAERGSYHEVLRQRAGERRFVEIGKYVSLARRGPDGVWRYEWSMFNRDAAPPRRP
jgi:ketosteroid isomerase-like protein/quercetin dioxygenase-like cupin family protein